MTDFLVETQLFKDNKNIHSIKPLVSDINAKGDDNHDPEKPIFTWFQDTPIGKELFVVFYKNGVETPIDEKHRFYKNPPEGVNYYSTNSLAK